jgi:hypothetical protein
MNDNNDPWNEKDDDMSWLSNYQEEVKKGDIAGQGSFNSVGFQPVQGPARQGNYPLQKWRERGISVAIFADEKKRLSISIHRQYKPKGGDTWRDTNTYFPRDVYILMKLLLLAKEFINQYEFEMRQAESPLKDRFDRM